MKKVLITDYVHPYLIDGLEELGFDVDYNKDFCLEDLDNILPALSGIVINSKIKMTDSRIKLAGKLEFIARLGSGMDIIDLKSANKHNIKLINTPEANCDAVAEHIVGMLLCLSNNLIKSDKEVRQKQWSREENRGFELSGKTLGIIGMGNTGRALATKLSSWRIQMIYNDPYILKLPSEYSYLKSVAIDELIERSDIISLHVQLTHETQHMINASFLDKCKRGVIIINSSRGAVVDTESLVFALQNGLVSGACLDVFENEKPHSFTPYEDLLYNKLYEMDNVVLSPHIAGWTKESLFKISQVLLSKLKDN